MNLSQFAKYAREFSKLPERDVPLIHFADATQVERVTLTPDQMVPHAEQMIARLAYGGDVAAAIILAPGEPELSFARIFREIAADAFPLEVYCDPDQALDRFQKLLLQVPKKRRVPSRDFA